MRKARRAGTYMLERTSVARLAPVDSEANPRHSDDSGAGPLLPSGSRAVLCTLSGSGIVLPTYVASK
jgi:hypothetical protein